jgi:signal transduction histidine kinase
LTVRKGVTVLLQTHAGRNPDLLIACSRLLLSATMLVMAISDDEEIGFVLEPDDVLLGYFTYLALAQLLILMTSWWLNYRLRRASFAIDIGLYVGLMYVVEPMDSGYFSSSITMLAFLIISAAVQWGWRRALQIAVVINLICIGMVAEMWASGMEMPYASLLRRQVFQLLVSIFLIWIATFAQSRWLRSPALKAQFSSDTLLDHQLEFGLSNSGGKTGALCWAELGEDANSTASIGLSDKVAVPRSCCSGSFERSLSGPALFDLRQGRVVALNQLGMFERTTMNEDEREFALRHGFSHGVFVPLAGASGAGWLVYRRLLFSGVEHLRLAREVGEKISTGFDNQNLIRTVEIMAADRQRLALARDLHDSVSQAFAGARYWIKSLRSRLTENVEVAEDLERLSKMLGAEQEQVQDLITALRAKNPGHGNADWQSELVFIVERLSKNWNVEIQLTTDGDGADLPRSTIYNLAQLVREAVANAVRHGQASKLTVSCLRQDQQLELTVKDNGKGFHLIDMKPVSLSGRLRELGGRLDLSSKAGSTLLVMTIPLGDD